MNITKNSIITLEDNNLYLYIDEYLYEDKNYILFMGIEEDEKTLIPNRILFAEEISRDGQIFIDIITDQKLIIQLIKIAKLEN